ncbi:MAG: DUF3168 domain-containing protein, partial [Microbacteriaceae bacterium]|nr:DUF3168 domain-containing protein [Microbacteriaceae bacterium]
MIGKVIYGRLTTDAAVTGVCGLRIYPDIAPQNVAYPFCIYTIINSIPVEYKDGQSNLEEVTIQVDVYSNNYDTTHNLSNSVRNRLDRFVGTVNNISVQTIKYMSSESQAYNADLNVYWMS